MPIPKRQLAPLAMLLADMVKPESIIEKTGYAANPLACLTGQAARNVATIVIMEVEQLMGLESMNNEMSDTDDTPLFTMLVSELENRFGTHNGMLTLKDQIAEFPKSHIKATGRAARQEEIDAMIEYKNAYLSHAETAENLADKARETGHGSYASIMDNRVSELRSMAADVNRNIQNLEKELAEKSE